MSRSNVSSMARTCSVATVATKPPEVVAVLGRVAVDLVDGRGLEVVIPRWKALQIRERSTVHTDPIGLIGKDSARCRDRGSGWAFTGSPPLTSEIATSIVSPEGRTVEESPSASSEFERAWL